MFNINKFCDNKCNNVKYNKIATSGNNPQISAKMRYSQLTGKKARPNFVQHIQYLTSSGTDIYINGSYIIGNIIRN